MAGVCIICWHFEQTSDDRVSACSGPSICSLVFSVRSACYHGRGQFKPKRLVVGKTVPEH